MRILIISNNAGGLYKFRKELLLAMIEKHNVLFCVPNGNYVDKLESIGCRYIPCEYLFRRSTNPTADWKLYRWYKSIIKLEQPDLVLTYTIKPNVYAGIACQKEGVKYIANVTGLGSMLDSRGGILKRIASILYRLGLRKASCVFFQNRENYMFFKSHRVFTGHSRLICGSGVNLLENCYEPYPSEEGGLHFLFVGRIMREKGIYELLDSFSIVTQTNSHVFLDIVGPIEENNEVFKKTVEKTSHVTYLGPQKDMHSLYARTHCVILPSYHEGMSNVLLEASATGRPVISTLVPGCQETFDEGISGFGCNVKSVDSLVETMNRFISLLPKERETMGFNARVKMEKEFNRDKVIEAYLEEIDRV